MIRLYLNMNFEVNNKWGRRKFLPTCNSPICGGCLTYTSAEQSSAVKHPPKQTHFNSDKKVNSKPSGSGRSPLNRFANRPVKPQSAFFEFCSFLVSEFFSLRYCFGRRVFYVVLFCFLTS